MTGFPPFSKANWEDFRVCLGLRFVKISIIFNLLLEIQRLTIRMRMMMMMMRRNVVLDSSHFVLFRCTLHKWSFEDCVFHICMQAVSC